MLTNVEEWEVWYTCTTYLETTSIDLTDCARRFIDSGVADFAMTRDGESFWRNGDGVASGNTIIGHDSSSREAIFDLRPHKGNSPKFEGCAREAWLQASFFLTIEQTTTHFKSSLFPNYVRAYLGLCVLTIGQGEDSRRINLYPTLTLFETGILMLELRTIEPSKVTRLNDLISYGADVPKIKFDRAEVNAGLAREIERAYCIWKLSKETWRRLPLEWIELRHRLAAALRTLVTRVEDSSFELAQFGEDGKEDLRSIAQAVFNTTRILLSLPRHPGLPFPVGRRREPWRLGAYWMARPHIHIIRFEGQCETASENLRVHKNALGCMLALVKFTDLMPKTGMLPKNLRILEDFSVHVGPASTLWTWSTSGLDDKRAKTDGSRKHYVYQHQFVVELLEYGYMLHRSLYHRINTLASTSEVTKLRRQVIELRRQIREATSAGETRELLLAGWREMGLPALTADIEASLKLRESETRAADSEREARIGWALAILFGLVAAFALAEQVIIPIWKVTGLREFRDPITALIADGVALLLTAAVLWIMVKLISNGRP